ncbi:MAG: trigger factor [Glomeribacter sp. 1016415]|nr:trigger factor [Glomeribacter sp. 1016415]
MTANINIENLGKLERSVRLPIAKEDVQQEINQRISKIAKNFKHPGFRPGKAPLKIVAQQHQERVQAEVLYAKAGQELSALSQAQNFRVAGLPNLEIRNDLADANTYTVDATFEIFPEVKVGDLSSVEITRTTTKIGAEQIDYTLDMLRKQRVHYHVRGEADTHGDGGGGLAAQAEDRVRVDWNGELDGKPFNGGSAENVELVLNQKKADQSEPKNHQQLILEQFENAVLGLEVGQTREFDLTFPEGYQDSEMAGKTARITLTLKKVEWPHYPEIDAAFVQAMGIESGDVEKLREAIQASLEREAKKRTQSLLKQQVMDAIIAATELDAPKILVAEAQQHLLEMMHANLEQRGLAKAKRPAIPAEIFKDQAERRVKLGLLLNELVQAHSLRVKPEQLRVEVEERAQGYADPQEAVRWYYADRTRLAEIENDLTEGNIVDFVLGQAKVTDKEVSFEELAQAATAQ